MAAGDSTRDHTETSVLSIKWYFVVVVVVVVGVVVLGRLTCLLRVMWWDWAVSRQADKDSPPGWSLLPLTCSQAAGEVQQQLTYQPSATNYQLSAITCQLPTTAYWQLTRKPSIHKKIKGTLKGKAFFKTQKTLRKTSPFFLLDRVQ